MKRSILSGLIIFFTILLISSFSFLISSCSLFFSPAEPLDLSDFQDLLSLDISTPSEEDRNIMFEDSNNIIVYHGYACAESKVNGTENIIRLQGRIESLPSYVKNATILLNGWNSKYLNKDHHVRVIASAIMNINFSERERALSWDAFGVLAEDYFDASYGWCYYYTIIAWNDNVIAPGEIGMNETGIDADVDHNDIGNIFIKLNDTPAEMNSVNEMELFQLDQNETIAILPRGYGVIKNEYSDDFHLLQYGYHLDYPTDLESPIVAWESNFIFKDDDSDDYFNVFEMTSAIGGGDIGIIKQPFNLKMWDDGNSGFNSIDNIQNEYVIEDIPYDYAIPLLTGWDLFYPQDEHVKEIGIWIDDFDYDVPSDNVPGTLTYSLSSILKDKNGQPKHAMAHNVTVLGIKAQRGKGDSSVTITAPIDNVLVNSNVILAFDSLIRDGEETNYDDLEWHSSIDGLLGTGKSIEVILSGPRVKCNPPSVNHKISIKIKGNSDIKVDPINVKVGEKCD